MSNYNKPLREIEITTLGGTEAAAADTASIREGSDAIAEVLAEKIVHADGKLIPFHAIDRADVTKDVTSVIKPDPYGCEDSEEDATILWRGKATAVVEDDIMTYMVSDVKFPENAEVGDIITLTFVSLSGFYKVTRVDAMLVASGTQGTAPYVSIESNGTLTAVLEAEDEPPTLTSVSLVENSVSESIVCDAQVCNSIISC